MRLFKTLSLGAAAAGLTALAVDWRARVAESAHPPRGKFLEIDGVRLHLMEHGSGAPIVYLHGNGAMIEEVEATGLIDTLSSSNRVIVFDRPGFGHSSRPRGAPWTPERQARLIGTALKRLNAAPAVVVAHSWATLVALALALDHPELVRGLVLISGYYFPEPRADVMLALPSIPVVGDIMRYTVSPAVGWALSDKIIARAFAPNRVPARFQAHFPVDMALRPSQLRAAAEEIGLMMPSAARLSRRYGELRCPVALLAGRSDEIVNPQLHTVRLGHVIPQATMRVLDGVGHMLPHIEPAAVVGSLTAFMPVGSEVRTPA